MSQPILKVKRLHQNAILPTRGHESDAGCDLTAINFKCRDNGVFLFQTGLAIRFQKGFILKLCQGLVLLKQSLHLQIVLESLTPIIEEN